MLRVHLHCLLGAKAEERGVEEFGRVQESPKDHLCVRRHRHTFSTADEVVNCRCRKGTSLVRWGNPHLIPR